MKLTIIYKKILQNKEIYRNPIQNLYITQKMESKD